MFSILMITILNFFLFFIINCIHYQLFTVSVVLYSALFDAFLSLFLSIVIYSTFLKKMIKMSSKEFFLIYSNSLLAITLYIFVIPVVFDRSVSLYILRSLSDKREELPIKDVKNLIKENYLDEMKVAQQRIIEQIETGSIELKDGKISLTERGKKIVSFDRFYSKYFLPQNQKKHTYSYNN